MADKSRPTTPPALLSEDSPPGVYRALPARAIKGEPVARVALRAPKVPASELDPQQQMLRALAATEGRMLIEIADRRRDEEQRQIDRQEAFEAELRREIQKLVINEVKSIPPPPPPPPEAKKRFEWPHLQYVAAFIVALTGLIALILNAQKPSAEVIAIGKKLDQHLELEKKKELSDYEYQLSVRSWVTDVLERAASVKIDDPPGTPKRDQLGFYPAPKIDPHKVTGTHLVQPRDPYPIPTPPE